MADEKVRLVIEVDGKNVYLIDDAEKKTKKLGETAETTGQQIEKKLGAIAIAAYAAMAYAAQKFVRDSLQVFAQFEKGMSDVSTLVDTGTESMKDMSKQVLDMAKRTPVAINDLTSALYDVRSAGISAGDAMGVLEAGAQLGVAGLASTKEATGALSLALNVFGDSAHDANRLADILFKTVKYGVTTISDVASGFGEVSSIAKEAGVSIEELQAATAAMTISNKSAVLSQTSIRAAITSILAPQEAMLDQIRKLGYESGAAMVQQLGLVGSMQALKDATNGDIDSLKKMYGRVEGLKAQLVLTGSQSEKFNEIMGAMGEKSNDLAGAFDKQAQTADALVKIYRNELQVEQMKVGSAIAITLGWLMKYNDMIDKVKESVGNWLETHAAFVYSWLGLVDKQGLKAKQFVEEQVLNRERMADLYMQEVADVQNKNDQIAEAEREKLQKIETQARIYEAQSRARNQREFNQKMQALLKEKLAMQSHWTYMLLGAKLNAQQRSDIDSALGASFTALTGLMSSKNKELFNIGKAAAIAQVTVNTIRGAADAVASTAIMGPVGWILGGAMAAAITAGGVASIAQIASTQMPQAEYGGIIPGSAGGTALIAGEKNRSEAIIPLEGAGAERLAQNLGGGGTIIVQIENFFADDERLPRRVAEAIDNELENLRRMQSSAFAVGLQNQMG